MSLAISCKKKFNKDYLQEWEAEEKAEISRKKDHLFLCMYFSFHFLFQKCLFSSDQG